MSVQHVVVAAALILLGAIPAKGLTADVDCAASYSCSVRLYGAACEAQGIRITSPDWATCIGRMADRYLGDPIPSTGRRIDPDSLEGRLTARYGERCTLVGYSPGTGAFGQCLLANADRDEAATQAKDAARMQLLLQLYGAQQAQAAQADVARAAQTRMLRQQLINAGRPGALCSTVLGNQIVTRPCY